jgi:hypothetical protein
MARGGFPTLNLDVYADRRDLLEVWSLFMLGKFSRIKCFQIKGDMKNE